MNRPISRPSRRRWPVLIGLKAEKKDKSRIHLNPDFRPVGASVQSGCCRSEFALGDQQIELSSELKLEVFDAVAFGGIVAKVLEL